MDNAKLLKYGTIALILIFVIEIIAMLFTSNPYSGIPTPLPSPSPTALPSEFIGINVTTGYVEGIANDMLVICNTTAQLQPIIEAIPGVAAASFDSQSGRIGVLVKPNNSVENVSRELKLTLLNYCTPYIFKHAYINLGEMLNFSSQDGSANKIIFGSSLQCLRASNFLSSQQCYGFIQPETMVNTSVTLTVFVRATGSDVTFLTAEESPKFELPVEKNIDATAKIIGQLPVGIATIDIPYELRANYSEEKFKSDLNGTINLTLASYSQNDIIEITNYQNDTLDSLLGSDFVLDAAIENDVLRILTPSNYTNKTGIQSVLKGVGILPGDVSFPSSKAALQFDFEPGAYTAINGKYPLLKVGFSQRYLAELQDVPALEKQLEAKIPSSQLSLVSKNATIDSIVDVSISVMVSNNVALSISGNIKN